MTLTTLTSKKSSFTCISVYCTPPKWSIETEIYFKNTTHYTKTCSLAHFFCLFMREKEGLINLKFARSYSLKRTFKVTALWKTNKGNCRLSG